MPFDFQFEDRFGNAISNDFDLANSFVDVSIGFDVYHTGGSVAPSGSNFRSGISSTNYVFTYEQNKEAFAGEAHRYYQLNFRLQENAEINFSNFTIYHLPAQINAAQVSGYSEGQTGAVSLFLSVPDNGTKFLVRQFDVFTGANSSFSPNSGNLLKSVPIFDSDISYSLQIDKEEQPKGEILYYKVLPYDDFSTGLFWTGQLTGVLDYPQEAKTFTEGIPPFGSSGQRSGIFTGYSVPQISPFDGITFYQTGSGQNLYVCHSGQWTPLLTDVTGANVSGSSSKTLSLYKRDGSTVTTTFTDLQGTGESVSGENWFVYSGQFNTGNGVLTLNRSGDNGTILVNFDGRYLTGVDLSSYASISYVSGISGYFSGQFNLLNSQTGNYVTGSVVRPSETGSFVVGDVVRPSETGGFVTGNVVRPSDTGVFATGSVVRPSDTGNFVTGDVVRPNDTGVFATASYVNTTSENLQTQLNTLKTGTINLFIGGASLTTGVKGYSKIPFDCTITGWEVVSSNTGSINLDIVYGDYSSFPALTNIVSANNPNLSAQIKNSGDVVGWTSGLSRDSYLGCKINSVSGVQFANINLMIVKS